MNSYHPHPTGDSMTGIAEWHRGSVIDHQHSKIHIDRQNETSEGYEIAVHVTGDGSQLVGQRPDSMGGYAPMTYPYCGVSSRAW